MKCSETQSQFDDYLDGLLTASKSAEIDLHLVSCRPCQAMLMEERKLRDNLRSLPVPKLLNGFTHRAVRVAMQSNVADRHRFAYMKGFGSAIAAGLCIWFLIGLFPSVSLSPSSGTTESEMAALNIQVIGIGLHQMRKVKLAFHTPRAMGGATISIRMPDNFAIVGYEDQQKLEWQTDLVKGDNVLTLPIKAMADDTGEFVTKMLTAQIKYANQVKTIRINLVVETPGITEPSVFERTKDRLIVV